jgi:DNA primase
MRVAEICSLKPDLVIADVERRRRRLVGGARKAEQRQQSRPERLMQPEAKALRYEDPASAAAEEGLIRLLYLEPGLLRESALPVASDFSAPALARIYEVLCRRIAENRSVEADALAGELTGDEMSLLVSLLQKPEALSRSRQSLADYIAKIRERKENREEQTNLLAIQKKMQKTKGYEG